MALPSIGSIIFFTSSKKFTDSVAKKFADWRTKMSTHVCELEDDEDNLFSEARMPHTSLVPASDETGEDTRIVPKQDARKIYLRAVMQAKNGELSAAKEKADIAVKLSDAKDETIRAKNETIRAQQTAMNALKNDATKPMRPCKKRDAPLASTAPAKKKATPTPKIHMDASGALCSFPVLSGISVVDVANMDKKSMIEFCTRHGVTVRPSSNKALIVDAAIRLVASQGTVQKASK